MEEKRDGRPDGRLLRLGWKKKEETAGAVSSGEWFWTCELESDGRLELHDTRRGIAAEERTVCAGRCADRAGDRTKLRAVKVGVRIREVRVVENVVGLRADPDQTTLDMADGESLHDGEVGVKVTGSEELVPALTTEAGGQLIFAGITTWTGGINGCIT